mmetsp:Transcript_22855/g.49612  ORF Transcript_22855/g.49612 Transcript_22855/m.49612 type:complete len:431 (+) Transcript_22855:205-1497(+)
MYSCAMDRTYTLLWLLVVVSWGRFFLSDPTLASMTRTLLFKAGGYLIWSGFYHRALDEPFVTDGDAAMALTFYRDIEDYDMCSRVFGEYILPQWDPNDGMDDDDFFGIFFSGIECMSHNGSNDAIPLLYRKIHPRSEEQREFQRYILEDCEQTKNAIRVQEPHIKIGLEFLRNKTFADVYNDPLADSDVYDPLIYVHYGRIGLMILFCILFCDMWKRGTSVKSSLTKLAILFAGYYLAMKEVPAMLLLLLLVWGWKTLFESGRRQGIILLALLAGLVFHSAHHSQSFPSRRLGLEGMISPRTLERARAQYVKYPYHHDELINHTGIKLVFLRMFQEGLKCQHLYRWMPGGKKQRRTYCREANEAARTALEMLDAADEETSTRFGSEFASWLTYSFFAAPPPYLSIEEQNKYRVEKGVPVSEEVVGLSDEL